MKNVPFKTAVVTAICYLYVLLFTYAAVSKLLDFENFQVQLGQSPLIAAFAGVISWLVPILELVLALMLVVPKSRSIGLYASFSLMVVFSAYIYIVLHFSSSIPCSCGGILEKMGWNQHLVFNLFFVVLGMVALLLSGNHSTPTMARRSTRKTIGMLASCLLLSVGLVVGLHLSSSKILRYHNNFIRIFPRMAAEREGSMDLQFNSFYIAGLSSSGVFLGNYTTPLKITEIDSSLKLIRSQQIVLDQQQLPFQSVQVGIMSERFFVYDGTVSCLFRGSTTDWKAELAFKGNTYMSVAVPAGSSTIVFRGLDREKSQSILGAYSIPKGKFTFNADLLQRQVDGIFDSDGMLHFDSLSGRLVYLYRYRNQYFTADKELQLQSRGTTIDTVGTAQIKVTTVRSHQQKKLAAPPLVVNKCSAVYDNLLFVNSMIMGNFEPEDMWQDTSIVDVYDLDSSSYLCSFYIYPVGAEKLRAFRVAGNRLYALVGNSLVAYSLSKEISKHYKNSIKATPARGDRELIENLITE